MASPFPFHSHQLGRYELLEKIGSGGMGTVFRAHDSRLHRDVALKVLNEGALSGEPDRRRFREEALALSKLNHRNIGMVLDFDSLDGLDFIVLELVGGVPLSQRIAQGPLSEREIVEIGIQVADAVSAAHRQGVVHRDLKPQNIHIDSDGQAKVLDFGLAKLVESDATVAATMDMPTGFAGTLHYMAPEQVSGGSIDERTDIYGLGAVLYEMATGQPPCGTNASLSEVVVLLLHGDPKPVRDLNPQIPAALEHVILRCLERNPAERYQTAGDLAAELRTVQRRSAMMQFADDATPPQVPRVAKRSRAGKNTFVVGVVALLAAVTIGLVLTYRIAVVVPQERLSAIAVLPLANLSGDAGQEYFADGMTEQLISDLTQVKDLRVISRTSIMQYKHPTKSLPQIAKELNVDGIVQGTVTRMGDHVRITVTLTRAANEKNLWSQSYDRPMGNVLELQSDVASAIVQQVASNVAGERRTAGVKVGARRPVIPEAYEAYLEGRFRLGRRTAEDLKQAVALFKQSIERDESYAPAHQSLAEAYSLLAVYGAVPPAEAMPKARTAVSSALLLDSNSGEAYATSAGIRFFYLQWDGAEQEFKRATELTPGSATAHHWYALFLAANGRSGEALGEIGKAASLDPQSKIIAANTAWCHYLARDYRKAEDELEQVVKRDEDFAVAHEYLGQVYLELGDRTRSVLELQRAVELSNGDPSYRADLANAYASTGQEEKARTILRNLLEESKTRYISSYDIALIYMGLRNDAEAITWLRKASEEHSTRLVNINVHPRFDRLRQDQRFVDVVREMKLDSKP